MNNIENEYFYGGLAPGETKSVFLSVGDFELPLFGFFKFYAGINLDKKVDEFNYYNNRLTERIVCIFGIWL